MFYTRIQYKWNKNVRSRRKKMECCKKDVGVITNKKEMPSVFSKWMILCIKLLWHLDLIGYTEKLYNSMI